MALVGALACTIAFATPSAAVDSEASQRPGDELEWSPVPGTFEQDLLRRHDNPIYAPSRREIGQRELLAAKRRDAEAAWEVLEEYISIAATKKRAARWKDAERMRELLARIDTAIARSLEVGGEAYQLVTSLAGMRAELVERWSEASLNDPDVQRFLSRERPRNAKALLSPSSRLLAQMTMKDGPIQDFERVPALLCEDEATIRDVVARSPKSQRSELARSMPLVVADLRKRPVEVDGLDRKIAVLRKSLTSSTN